MSNVTLIVEGKADEQFLKHFIEARFGPVNNGKLEFIKVEGKVEKLDLVQPSIQASSFRGRTNLLIFDLDGNILVDVFKEVDQKCEQLGIKLSDKFLFPDNSTEGSLETLLKRISRNPEVLQCIDSYQSCISQLSISQLRDIDDKAKIFIYVDSFVGSGSAKEHERDYLNGNLWDLNSNYLKALYDFLSPYFAV